MTPSQSNYSDETDSDENSDSYERSYTQSKESSSINSTTNASSDVSKNKESHDTESMLSEDWKNFHKIIGDKNKTNAPSHIFQPNSNEFKSTNSRQKVENTKRSSSNSQDQNENKASAYDVYDNNKEFNIIGNLNKQDNTKALWNSQSKKLLESELKDQKAQSKNILKQPQRVYATRNLAFGNCTKNKDFLNKRFNQDVSDPKNIQNKKVNLNNKDFVGENKKYIGIQKTRNYQSIMIEHPEFKIKMNNKQEKNVQGNQTCKKIENPKIDVYQNKTCNQSSSDIEKAINFYEFQEHAIFNDSEKNKINQDFKAQNNPTDDQAYLNYLNNLSINDYNFTGIETFRRENDIKNCFETNSGYLAQSGSYEMIDCYGVCNKCNKFHNYVCQYNSQDKLCFNSDPSYRPYTLKDYKKITDVKIMGGLGPNIGGNKWKQKNFKMEKLKDFGAKANEQNLKIMKKSNKPVIEMKINEAALNRRVAALKYAKSIPIPRKKVNAFSPSNYIQSDHKTRTHSIILKELKERHDKEKELVEKLQQNLRL